EERTADEKTIDQADEKLAAKISDDVVVDLRKHGGDFILQGRIAQREIFAPAPFDCRAFLEQEKQVDRHHNQTEEKSGDPEKAADALLQERPDFFAEIRQLPLEVGQLFLDPLLDALAIGGSEFLRRGRDRFRGSD